MTKRGNQGRGRAKVMLIFVMFITMITKLEVSGYTKPS